MLSNGEEDFLLDESSVLAFLADCEIMSEVTPLASSFATSTPTQCDTVMTTWSDSTSSTMSPEKQPTEKKSWRQRRKEEVLQLREVVKQLSTELERHKRAAGVQSTLPTVVESTPEFVMKAQAAHKTEASVMWEKIAGRQSMLRLHSEEENAKLRKAVARQLQQAKSLQRAIKRKLREDMVSSTMGLIQKNRLNMRGVTPPLDNKVVLDKLMAGLDDVYKGIDSFFEDTGMNQLSCPGRRNNSITSRRSRDVFVEFLDNYPLPFDVCQTAKAIWTPEEDLSDNANIYFLQVRRRINFKAGSSTQMVSMAFDFCVDGVDFRTVMRSVTRKFVENGRIVFISRSLIQPLYEDISLAFTETRRMVLKSGDLSSLGPTTMMQTHREAIMHGDLSATDTIKYPSLDIGLKNWENSITRYNNRVEDQLVRAVN
ncbi:Hypothetical protein PHPALM_36222 [Phytophthora palmivora]|uniref:M96 mating-specific protein family n=1 Tax=Phytophthora palmivora TaxID=4796 RepID=A0A2P4X0H6_9STRA|nr:Hypothetical protein PHPALM_36222 [Phytophthora palmivora]